VEGIVVAIGARENEHAEFHSSRLAEFPRLPFLEWLTER